MEITEVVVTLVEGHSKLRAFVRIVLDGSILVDALRIIEVDGRFFVSMPSKNFNFHCPYCHQKNDWQANYCNACGERIDNPERMAKQDALMGGHARRYSDIAFPITNQFRLKMEQRVLKEYVSTFNG